MDLEKTIWYEVWLDDIRQIKVQRSTESSVWIEGRRSQRISDHRSYFPTWDEAKTFLIERAQQKVDSSRSTLEYYSAKLEKAKARMPPVSATAEQK